jgi:hypothetical protein
MPHRPPAHVVADVAVNQVEALFLEQGWAVERIERDYGEDLLVQTTLGSVVDPYRVLVQVKGSKTPPKTKFHVGPAHFWRWRNNSELVVLVQWNITARSGVYIIPERVQVRPGDGSATMTFDISATLNSSACKKLGWQARVRHWARTIAILENRMDLVPESDDAYNAYWRTALEFCQSLGLMEIGPDATYMVLSNEARDMVYRVYRSVRREGLSHADALDRTSFLVFMYMHTKTTQVDLDISLLRPGASVTFSLLKGDSVLQSFSNASTSEVETTLARFLTP